MNKCNTIIVSDLHLTEAQQEIKNNPLWMSYKKKEFFIDESFSNFLQYLESNIREPIELILNGDIFDFDTVLAFPNQNTDWLSKLRGLGTEEWMSLFKINIIIKDHPVWFAAIKKFILHGNKVIFIVGNHDIELYWPSVQRRICEELKSNSIIFCNWFYLSEGDSYISHGHQYDPNCVVKDTINPLIKTQGKSIMRIPFGDLATRYIMNGMGLLNPHYNNSYIKTSWEHFLFFFRYLKTQPLMVWSWFWGAVITFIITLRDHWKPAMIDPLLIEKKVVNIARDSNVTPSQVRQLSTLRVSSASSNPLNIFRELWLDRGMFLISLLFIAWQIMLYINIAFPINMGWFIIPFILLLPALLVYASSIKPKIFNEPLLTSECANYILTITGAKYVVFGHTHSPTQEHISNIEYINCGSWASAFSEPECLTKTNEQTYVWIKPCEAGRIAKLNIWPY